VGVLGSEADAVLVGTELLPPPVPSDATALLAADDADVTAEDAAVAVVLDPLPACCWVNGSRAELVRRECAGVDCTSSAGIAVPDGGGGVACGA
jgi:hypothetical protein